jgi:hypothetical protein
LIIVAVTSAGAQDGRWSFSMRADQEPQTTPWDEGASLAWQEVNGNRIALADMMLEWSHFRLNPVVDAAGRTKGATRRDLGFGAYWHRNTDETNPVNDRGVSGTFVWSPVGVGEASGAVRRMSLFVDARAGWKLLLDPSGVPGQTMDDHAHRVMAGGKYSHVFAVSGEARDSTARSFLNFSAQARGYWDRVGGQAIVRSVGGIELGGRLEWAPFGIDPSTRKLGLIPVLTGSVTYQKDLAVSQNWDEADRRLLGIGLRLPFRSLGVPGFSPSIVAEYSDGADILTGRPQCWVQKVAFAVRY